MKLLLTGDLYLRLSIETSRRFMRRWLKAERLIRKIPFRAQTSRLRMSPWWVVLTTRLPLQRTLLKVLKTDLWITSLIRRLHLMTMMNWIGLRHLLARAKWTMSGWHLFLLRLWRSLGEGIILHPGRARTLMVQKRLIRKIPFRAQTSRLRMSPRWVVLTTRLPLQRTPLKVLKTDLWITSLIWRLHLMTMMNWIGFRHLLARAKWMMSGCHLFLLRL